MFDSNLRPGRIDATGGDAFASHTFPAGGLVAQSRIAYEFHAAPDGANPLRCFRLRGRRGQSDGDYGIAGGSDR